MCKSTVKILIIDKYVKSVKIKELQELMSYKS
jgi:hypothetical protein